MTTSEFKPYKVDHLFLLIGENPLPNYVAAKLLLKEGGTVYLVHSTDTTSKAACLERSLKGINVKPISLVKHEANSCVIKSKIQTEVKNILTNHPKHTFGLNYTGGTKAMSVHGYRALFEASGVQNPVFSYLDARTLQMFIDRDNDSPKAEAVDIKLSLKEIFALHDLRWETTPITNPLLPELAIEFAKLHTDKKVVIAWHWWCDNVLKPGTKILKKKSNKLSEWEWKKEVNSELSKIEKDLIIPLNPDIVSYKLIEELDKLQIQEEGKNILENFKENNFQKIREICNYCNALWDIDHAQYIEKIGDLLRKYLDSSLTELALKKAADKAGFEKLKHLCEWLQGNWLEHYVLQKIQEVSQANPGLIHDTGLSFKVRDKKKREEGKDKFEFDVAFMKGYQLFALSCTTDASKSLCKSKLFEAYIRAQQLGGEQARVALVCCYDKPKELEAELKVDTEVKKEDPKIIVFGCEHLDDIQKYIKNWIDDNNRYYAP
ncbi:Card1-like endonuclease domain-containing protein [Nostoc sp. FACHB-190]|uniref:Card1-like endonuclease domain-containing protein n=1 Tax=Nostoc sp. FACHB-190 TaxID=2692838 RepID=UPI00168380B0|nr:DUF1887 family CARF protein [Nostoc sp. FACHB-190]MBD2302770.1 DUF1887 family protein [Nostoc sp. FACHB-190]